MKEIPTLIQTVYNKKLKDLNIEGLKKEIIDLGEKIYNETLSFINEHDIGLYCEPNIRINKYTDTTWKYLHIVREEDIKVSPYLQSTVDIQIAPFERLIMGKLGLYIIRYSSRSSAYNRFRERMPKTILSDIKNYKAKYLQFFKADKAMRSTCNQLKKQFDAYVRPIYTEFYESLLS